MDINRELAEIFGECWHEWVTRFDAMQAPYFHCPECDAESLSADMPNYLRLVELKCGECGGDGGIDKSGVGIEQCLSSDIVPCPTCHGSGIRIISRLQEVMEDKGWWGAFIIWLFGHSEIVKELTDLNQMGYHVKKWRESL